MLPADGVLVLGVGLPLGPHPRGVEVDHIVQVLGAVLAGVHVGVGAVLPALEQQVGHVALLVEGGLGGEVVDALGVALGVLRADGLGVVFQAGSGRI